MNKLTTHTDSIKALAMARVKATCAIDTRAKATRVSKRFLCGIAAVHGLGGLRQ